MIPSSSIDGMPPQPLPLPPETATALPAQELPPAMLRDGQAGPAGSAGEPWHALAPTAVLARLGSGPDGLRADDAARRLAQYSPNVLRRTRSGGPIELLWRQINSPLVWVLIGSALIAVLLGKITDGLVVLAVVVLNSLIGFVQEHRAGRAIEALSAMVPENATVRRDGQALTVPVAALVPGDIVLVAAGDKVPADMRLVGVKNLQIDESALTGESVPVEKHTTVVAAQAVVGDRAGMAFGGTLVTYGTGTGVVTSTGNATELGRISSMLEQATDLQTPLTKALATIGAYITVAIVAIAFVLLAVGTWRLTAHGMALAAAFTETAMFAIALAVAAIPEGLPAIVTIALAIGVRRMAARRAIIRNLPAAETLGSTSVICSDKTGTLTRNEMTVQALWTPDGEYEISGVGYAPDGQILRSGTPCRPIPFDAERLLRNAALCNDAGLQHKEGAWTITGDPTEGALVVAAEKAGVLVDATRTEHPRRDVVPFESENQFMATLHATPNGARVVLKGAPEVVLRRCALTAQVSREAIEAELERLAGRGMRVLAVADKEWTNPDHTLTLADTADGFHFCGLIGMTDPPRAEAIEAIRACHRAGITVKMITGDHHATARAIATQLGLTNDGRALTGAELASMNDDQLFDAAQTFNVFARVAPEHKLRLVKALQVAGHVAAMTGDGVNDAPALKQANIGVAMGITGTSVSKEAADIVLTDDNFASIAAAVEEGRRVYDNLIKSLAFVLPTNIGLAFILIFAVAFFPLDPLTGHLLLPMQPTQLLWINLVSTVALALPLAFEAKERDVMLRPPRPRDEPVLNRFVLTRTLLVALVMAAGAVGLFHWELTRELAAGRPEPAALAESQTMAVTTVIMFQIFYLLKCRSLRRSMLAIGVFSNPVVFAGIGAIVLLQVAFIYWPALQSVFATHALPPFDLLTATAVGAIVLPIIALEKAWASARGRG